MLLAPLALTALLFTADPGFDTVFLQNGGRVRGTVVEESPTAGVTIQIPGGQLRTVPPADVFRIEYRDGTIGALGQAAPPPAAKPGPPAPPAPPPVAAEAPAAAPPSAEPPPAETRNAAPPAPVPPAYRYPEGAGPPPGAPPRPPPPPPPPMYSPRQARPAPFMLAGGIGFMAPSGNAASGYAIDNVSNTLFLLQFEGGLRFSPEIMGSLVLDVGVGDPGRDMRSLCELNGGTDCTAIAVKFGVHLRYAFTPTAPQTGWVSVGYGGEVLGVSGSNSANSSDVSFTGPEWRLGTGFDFRGNGQFGWGLFLNAGFGTYTRVHDFDGTSFRPNESSHTWIQAGVRAIILP